MYIVSQDGYSIQKLNELWISPEANGRIQIRHKGPGQYADEIYTVLADYKTIDEAKSQIAGIDNALYEGRTAYWLRKEDT